MGGEDWNLWIDKLISEDMIADGFTTVAYSYIGPALTHAIYKDGTIGRAKNNLFEHCKTISGVLKPFNGRSIVSVNKALVTQASSAIPVVPLYISLLYKVMKEKGIHENCYEQIKRMFLNALYSDSDSLFDNEYCIRMDDLEMQPDVQAEIERLWPMITTENNEEITDIEGYRNELYNLYGFARDDVDYDEDIPDLT